MLHFVERRGKFKQDIKYRDRFLKEKISFSFLKNVGQRCCRLFFLQAI